MSGFSAILKNPGDKKAFAVANKQAPFFKPFIQPKLTVNQPNDIYEQEADTMADKVMRMPDDESIQEPFFKPTISSVQRKCDHCEEEEKKLQRKETSSEIRVNRSTENYVDSLSGGRSLNKNERSFFEPRMGYDFSNVRLHTDSAAHQSATNINALAYTHGNNIVFGSGQYQPASAAGKRLLAHELTHVLQQQNGNVIQLKECSATRVCSAPDTCNQPDTGEKGSETESTWWTLTVNIDIEKDDFETALRKGKLGHTNLRFSESNGKQYTYGFYPATETPNENKRSVEGCVNHPDTSHDECIDTTTTFFLTKPQYEAALQYSQNFCRGRHYYGLNASNFSYTCTTFAAEVATAAGKNLPASASVPTTIYYQPVPSIDNPNTLNENLKARNEGMGSTETEVLSMAEMGGPNLLNRYPWQEKARWIRILLEESWITDRDVNAIVNICTTGMDANDLKKINSAVTSLVNNMNTTSQQKKVQKALAGSP